MRIDVNGARTIAWYTLELSLAATSGRVVPANRAAPLIAGSPVAFLQWPQHRFCTSIMALFELTDDNSLAPVPSTTFRSLGKLERHHIQRALRMQIEAITPGVRTMVLAEEFGDWVGSPHRLAVHGRSGPPGGC